MYAYSATGDINHNYTQLIHSGNFKNLKGAHSDHFHQSEAT